MAGLNISQNAVAITPSDSVDLVGGSTNGIYVGGAGSVTLITAGGQTVLFTAPPVGSIIPVAATRVKSTGTTATLLVALY